MEFTFYVEATAVLVPAFQANLVAQDGEETFKLFTTSLCYEMKIDDCIKWFKCGALFLIPLLNISSSEHWPALAYKTPNLKLTDPSCSSSNSRL